MDVSLVFRQHLDLTFLAQKKHNMLYKCILRWCNKIPNEAYPWNYLRMLSYLSGDVLAKANKDRG